MASEREKELEQAEFEHATRNQRLEFEHNDLLVTVKEKICSAVAIKTQKERQHNG